jgi:hypothetical protein
LGQHPDAGLHWNQALDGDFERLHPQSRPGLLGFALAMKLALTFLAGGLFFAFDRDRRFSYGAFLAAAGRSFPRNFRVLLVLLVAMTAWVWVCDVTRDWLGQHLATSGDPQAGWQLISLHQLGYSLGVLLLGLWSVVAMATLWCRDDHSAVLAWLRAGWTLLGSPVRVVCGFGGLFLMLMLGQLLFGFLVAWRLERSGDVWGGLVAGQLAVYYNCTCLLAVYALARGLVGPTAAPTPT